MRGIPCANGKVRLTYIIARNERALLTTDAHPELVEMVNAAKRAGGAAQPGGSFVINEFRQVLVPTSGVVLCPGVYTRDLEFEFEATVISPVAPAGLLPGQTWRGPHVGIRYTVAAGGTDIRYDEKTSRGTWVRMCLSDVHAAANVQDLLAQVRRHRPAGGVIYVNEAREMFAPVANGDGYDQVYVGHLGLRPWFPEPPL